MRKVFSSIILLFIFPLKIVKRLVKDNFLSGLVFGAIFSLIVNVISMQIQGVIDKQRVLEAIENEIITNNMQAEGNVNAAINNRKNKAPANRYLISRKFSKDIWEQSIEPLQYLAQLESKQQIEINVYYSIAVPSANQLIETLNNQFIDSTKDCFDFEKVLTAKEQTLCNDRFYFYLENIALYPSKMVYQQGDKMRKIFHPTQDRLKNPFLRFLMGKESMRILSGN